MGYGAQTGDTIYYSANQPVKYEGKDAEFIRTSTGSQIRYGAAGRGERRAHDARMRRA